MVSETRSGGSTELLEPAAEVRQRRDVVEAAVTERRAVVALGRGAPADLAVEPVVVVVAGEGRQGRLGVLDRAEHLAIEDLALERRPERLDLSVRPGRVDLGLDVPDLELAEGLAELW